MGEKTNLVLANKSESLRTTVPASIVKQLGMKVGDQVEWILKPNGKEFAIVLKVHKN